MGKNLTGQLGNGTTTGSTLPVAVLNLANVTVIGAGGFHSLAVESDGSVWAWGNDSFGQVGNGTATALGNTGIFTPTQVLSGTQPLTGVINVVGGGFEGEAQHSLALKSNGTVWGWGSDSSGQLGDGSGVQQNSAVPVQGLSNVVALAAGGQHSLVLKNDGTVWAFGLNANGQLGIGNTTNQLTPVQITALSGIVAIAAGNNHSLAVKNDGTVWAWGDNSSGQLGDGTTTQTCGTAACSLVPVQVSGVSTALLTPSAVAAGSLFSLVVKSDGTVWAWGDNTKSELGNGSTGGTNSVPVQVSNLSGVTAISAEGAGSHALALKSDGTVWGWGSDVFGQLGDGTNFTSRNSPVQMQGLATRVASIAAGGSHSVVLEAINPQVTADPSGQVENLDTTGSINTTGAFFQSLGTNGRTCATCHIASQGWSISASQATAVFNATQGLDPLFAPVDGTNSPTMDMSTLAARQKATTLLVQKGDFRIGIGMPASAEFSLTGINDPYNFATAQQLSLFRRPLASTNLAFQSSVMWDGRETVQPLTTTNTSGQNLAALTFDLAHQSVDATTGHAQASVPPTTGQQNDIVNFELGLITAQGQDNLAGSLTGVGATGGSQALSTQAFAIGENQFGSTGFTSLVFTLFGPWETLTGTDAVSLARESIGRGEVLFNTRQFQITGVNGLNDVLNQPAITGTCSTCHNAPNLGNNSLDGEFDTGISIETTTSGVNPDFPSYTFTRTGTGETVTLEDPGEGLITGKWADIGKFKVPLLRGLAARAPYFHNGTGFQLGDVVHSYDVRFNIGLSIQDKTDLINFLNSL
jgi:alpha-tubulin suppressor-like RCC1 family protein